MECLKNVATIHDLPVEVLLKIVEKMKAIDAIKFLQTSKHFYSVTNTHFPKTMKINKNFCHKPNNFHSSFLQKTSRYRVLQEQVTFLERIDLEPASEFFIYKPQIHDKLFDQSKLVKILHCKKWCRQVLEQVVGNQVQSSVLVWQPFLPNTCNYCNTTSDSFTHKFAFALVGCTVYYYKPAVIIQDVFINTHGYTSTVEKHLTNMQHVFQWQHMFFYNYSTDEYYMHYIMLKCLMVRFTFSDIRHNIAPLQVLLNQLNEENYDENSKYILEMFELDMFPKDDLPTTKKNLANIKYKLNEFDKLNGHNLKRQKMSYK